MLERHRLLHSTEVSALKRGRGPLSTGFWPREQWANNKIITNLNETYEPFGTLRRGDHITVLIKQTNKEIPGEFLGRLVLGVEDGEIKIFGATIY